MQSPVYTRAAMATPAILLFAVTCLAHIIIPGIRGGGGNSNNHDESHDLVRGSIIDENEYIAPLDHRQNRGRQHQHQHGGSGKTNNSPSSKSQGDDDDGSDFDFYVYSMSYQPEFCHANNAKFAGCHNPKELWEGQLTIHGLWPNRNDGSWPSDCSDESFDFSLLQNVADDLEQNWPNVKSPAASSGHASFWSHEWAKHGTCSGLTQEDYFMTALDLLLPTPSIVKEKYGSVASREDLEKGYLGSDMSVFVCKRGYLSEVRVCFEKMENGSPGERVLCPETLLKADSCGDEINIASFDSKVTPVIA